MKAINLPTVSKTRGVSVMDALQKKASAECLSGNDLSMQDLSDLLWAAAGINRADCKKRTYSSAMNTQEIDVYVLMKDGAYLYDYETHSLKPVVAGDYRSEILFKMKEGVKPKCPVFAVDLILVSNPCRYCVGTDDLKREWGAFSAGLITQNVMLFCAANGMGTRPRAAFDKANVRGILKLEETQNPVIELPVGYAQ